DGDRYVTFDCAGSRAFAWLTSWDSEYDAQQFADAYRAIAAAVARRASLAAEPRVEVRGNEAMIFTPELAGYAEAALAGAKRARATTLDDALAASATATAENEAASVTVAGPTRSG